jgi:16S rRNA G966 N2-methylase RsmD
MQEAKDFLSTLYTKSYYLDLTLTFKHQHLINEYSRIQQCEPSYLSVAKHNDLILHFQPNFYAKEKELWKNNEVKYKLVANRCKYINKGLGQLTKREILRGFKISGMHIGYSHFCQQWLRQFILDYDVTSIYDPCGGWGHRLTAVSPQFKYIYNDINLETYLNVKKMSKFLNMKNKKFFNKDSSKFYPKKFVNKIDAIFTCPPYFNTEIYSELGAENLIYSDYLLWWEKTVKQCLKLNPKYFAFVINHKYGQELTNICKKYMKLEKIIELGTLKSHLNKRSNKNEYLVVFRRNI